MDLPRVVFSREVKLAAIRDLEAGVGRAAVARKYQINPSMLYRWRQQWQAKGTWHFPATASAEHWCLLLRGRGASPSWSARSASSRWRTIFKKSVAAFEGTSPVSRRQWRTCLFEEVRHPRRSLPRRDARSTRLQSGKNRRRTGQTIIA